MTDPDTSTQQPDTASSVMDPHPTVVKATDLIHSAIEHIMKHRYRHLPVVDNEGRYLGIFGVNCLLRLVLPKAAVMDRGLNNLSFIHETPGDLHDRLLEYENEPVTTCMRTNIQAVYPDTPLVETLHQLYKTECCVPVVAPDSGKLLGMISYFDVGRHVMDS